MNVVQSVMLMCGNPKMNIKIEGFRLKCKLLVNLIIKYCNKLKEDGVKKSLINNCVFQLKNASFIPIDKLNIEGFKKMQSNKFMTVKLRPLAELPDNPPEWLYHCDMIGIWHFINISPGIFISDGEIFDISRSLINIYNFAVANKNKKEFEWLKGLCSFFFEVVNKKNNIAVIKVK